MPTRLAFNEELKVLEDDLLAMADLVQVAIDNAVRALLHHDVALATEVIEGDERINDLYTRIEQSILEVIATQQPMATDLREVLAIYSISTDLERIADYAKGIGRAARKVEGGGQPSTLVHIEQMSELVRQILVDEMDAFIRRDADDAATIARRDDEIDRLYRRVYQEVVTEMTQGRTTIEAGERLLWVAKSLERGGDHVTNIGERVVFLTSGRHVELND
jgi:phosphate transport system protein